MAEARKWKKEEKVVAMVDKIDLTLSIDEAKTLAFIMGCIGGHNQTTARKHTDSVLKALRDVVETPKLSVLKGNRAIYFADAGTPNENICPF